MESHRDKLQSRSVRFIKNLINTEFSTRRKKLLQILSGLAQAKEDEGSDLANDQHEDSTIRVNN